MASATCCWRSGVESLLQHWTQQPEKPTNNDADNTAEQRPIGFQAPEEGSAPENGPLLFDEQTSFERGHDEAVVGFYQCCSANGAFMVWHRAPADKMLVYEIFYRLQVFLRISNLLRLAREDAKVATPPLVMLAPRHHDVMS
jgi:hypothetical protein